MNANLAARWLALLVLLSAGFILVLDGQRSTDTIPASPEDTVILFVDSALQAIPPHDPDALSARTALDCLTDDTRATVLESASPSPGSALGKFLGVSRIPDSGCQVSDVVLAGNKAIVDVRFNYADRALERRFELVRGDPSGPWLRWTPKFGQLAKREFCP